MNFTYLLGAGASANTMPVIANFAARLDKYSDELRDYEFRNNNFPIGYHSGLVPSEIRNILIKDLEWLIKECEAHSSIDTFARKLYLTNNDKALIKLKVIISDFLLYEQYFKGIDKRYDAFFATILKHDESREIKLPDNINILSWNYDKQIEFSIGQFMDKVDQDSVEDFLNIYPRKEMRDIDRTCFNVIKMNGTIGGLYHDNNYYPMKMNYGEIKDKIQPETKEIILLNILDRYNDLVANITTHNIANLERRNPTILYSWENSDLLDMLKSYRNKAIFNCHYLVIIGYSFPTFNRNVDKSILEGMPDLKKIFLQIPENDFDGVAQRLQSLLDGSSKIEQIDNVEEFYIPFEY